MVASASNFNTDTEDSLKTIGADGKVPTTRMNSASGCVDLVNKYVRADQTRARKRAKAQGLIDGNPPYKASDQKAAGMEGLTNINFRQAESFLSAALGAFYDVFSEAPTFATVLLSTDDPNRDTEWSQIATEEFDRLQRRQDGFDFNMRLSQLEMVTFATGPLVFLDEEDWRETALRTRELLVPDNAKGDASKWEIAVLLCDDAPHALYERIMNAKAATEIGWNVPVTRAAIMSAHPKTQGGSTEMNWEWHQQQLKNSSFAYSAQSKAIFTAHILFKEFPKDGEYCGRISHKIVLRSPSSYSGNPEFLFEKVGRFKEWKECVHPMYYDIGAGGEHHAVTGMGTKMYAAMELQNRMLCNLADKAMAPKVLLKPTTASAKEVVSVGNMSEFGLLPAGYDVQQTGLAGMLDDGIGFNRELSGIIAANLSQYRQNLQRDKGNPITATEAEFRASEQARLGKTQLNRYYEQWDAVEAEKYRRATNPNLTKFSPGGEAAIDFQDRCKKRGVPLKALRQIESVKATRIIGQGSQFQRQQALEWMLGLIAMLPEDGRTAVIDDSIASRAGQALVRRYNPKPEGANTATDQHAFAMLQVSAMKDGVPPVITSTQNPVIYAQTFLQAASQALGSLEQGANPVEVLAFLELAGPAAAAHLDRMRGDKSREGALKVLEQQWKEVAKLTDQLQKQVQQQQEQQQAQAQEAQAAQAEQQAKAQAAMSDEAIKARETQAKIDRDNAKAVSKMGIDRAKAGQKMAIDDLMAASQIRNQNATKTPTNGKS